jgi:hypothetical protein
MPTQNHKGRPVTPDLKGQQDTRNTPAAQQLRAAAEADLSDACRRLLAAGVAPGFISIAFGRAMQKLTEAPE